MVRAMGERLDRTELDPKGASKTEATGAAAFLLICVGVLLGNENAVFLSVLATVLHKGDKAVTFGAKVLSLMPRLGLVSGFGGLMSGFGISMLYVIYETLKHSFLRWNHVELIR